MAASGAIWAKGVQLKRGNGATPEVFTVLAEVVSLSSPGLTADMIEVTNHQSDGGYEEFVAGVIRTGSISVEINWQPTATTHAQILTDIEARDVINFQLIWPDTGSTTWTLPCLPESFSQEAPVEGKLAGTYTLKVTGQPTLA